MKQFRLIWMGCLLAGILLTACGGSARQGLAFLPELQPIIAIDADEVALLQTLEIPNYQRGRISQCSLDFSPDGSRLVGACGRNPVPVWDVQSGELLFTLYDGSEQIVACDFSPNGRTIACGGFDQLISFWDAATGKLLKQSDELPSPLWELDYSPDGTRLALCSLAGSVQLRDEVSLTEVWHYEESNGYLSVAFLPSGEGVVYGGRYGDGGLLQLWNGERVGSVTVVAPMGDVAVSPDGDLMAGGTDANLIYLWDTLDFNKIGTLSGHTGYVNGVAFSPDGALLASGSHDTTVAIWDVAGQYRLAALDGHEREVLRVAFNPDGTLIASISWDGTVRLWGVPAE